MNISQLIKIATYISGSIEANGICNHYQSLIGLCRRASDGDSAVTSAMVGETLRLLEDGNSKLDPKSWDRGVLRIYEKLENPSLFGRQASELLRGLYEQSKGDYSLLLKELEGNHTRILALLNQLGLLVGSLEPLVGPSVEIGDAVDNEERNHLLQIYFEGALFIKDINQLEKFCRIWSSILSSFTTLTREKAEEVGIYDIEMSSITFYAGIRTLNALSNGAYRILYQYQRILEIKRMQQELTEMELNNAEVIVELLEDEISNVVDEESSAIASELLAKYEWDEELEDGADVYRLVKTSLKQTLSFVEKGGRIFSNHSSGLKAVNEKVVQMLQSLKEAESRQQNAEIFNFESI